MKNIWDIKHLRWIVSKDNKRLKRVQYFRRELHLRYLTGLEMRLTSAINFFLVTYELSLSKKNLPSSDRGTHAYEKEIRRSIRNLTKVNDYIQCMALTFWNVVSVLKNTFAYLMSYWTSFSAGLDKLHARRRACTQRGYLVHEITCT